MAFTVEDGTGVAGANAIITVQFFRDYHTDRGVAGVDEPTLGDSAVQALIVRATDHFVQRFGNLLKGCRATDTQTLPLPRSNIRIDGVCLPDDEIPLQIQNAIAIYSLVAKDVAALMPNPPLPFDTTDADGEVVSGGGAVVEREEKVGPIEERVRLESVRDALVRSGFSGVVDAWVIPQYPAADLLVEPFIGGGRGRVLRA